MKSIPIYRLIDKEVPFNLPRSIILMTFLDTVRDTHPPPSENPLAVLRVSLLHTKSGCERLHLAKEHAVRVGKFDRTDTAFARHRLP